MNANDINSLRKESQEKVDSKDLTKTIKEVKCNGHKWDHPLSSFSKDFILIIFSKCGIAESLNLVATAKFFYEKVDQNFYKNLVIRDNQSFQDLLDLYPNLKNLNNKKINWKKICLDKEFNPERLTSKDRLVMKLYSQKQLKNNVYIPYVNPEGGLFSYTNPEEEIILDKHKITTNKLKKIIIKYFGLKCKPEDLLIWDMGLTLHPRQEKRLIDDSNIKKMIKAITADEYSAFSIGTKQDVLCTTRGHLEPITTDYYFGTNREIKAQDVPTEWMLDEDDERCRCKCILF